MTVYLWDLSNHDWGRHPVDLADARKAGISGVTHKATEDTSYRDPYLDSFAHQLRAMRDPFPVAGTYHVLHSGQIAAQVKFWWEYVNDTMPWWRTHGCWLWQVDAERWADGYPTPAEVDQFADAIQAKAKCHRNQVPVYGPKWLYGDRLRVTDKPLWQSAYGANPKKAYRKAYPGDRSEGWHAYGGKVPLILQYGSRTTIGRQSTCDANAVRVATEADLSAVFNPTSAGPAPADAGHHPITPTAPPTTTTSSSSSPQEAASMYSILYDQDTKIWYAWAPGYWRRLSAAELVFMANRSACINGRNVRKVLAATGKARAKALADFGFTNNHTILTKNFATKG